MTNSIRQSSAVAEFAVAMLHHGLVVVNLCKRTSQQVEEGSGWIELADWP